jgi:hypothetical protein
MMIAWSFQQSSILPLWLTWLLAALLVGMLMHGTITLLRKGIQQRWVAFLGGMRLLIVTIFLLILFQPVFSYPQEKEQLPELMVLVDTSRSMGQTGGQGQTRLDEVVSVLEKSNLVNTLEKRYRLHWFQFDSTALPFARSELSALKPAGALTRYAESITSAWDQLRALGKAPERILFVSDGNDLGKNDPVEAARALGTTIDTLAPTSDKRPEDAATAIADVQCARRVLLGSETHFRVTLSRTDPVKDQTLRLRLDEDGKKVWEQDVLLKAGQSEQTVTLAHRPGTKGTKQYDFQLGPAAKPFPVSVQVVDSKYEVLILEDTWRWEFKYLKRLFEDDPSFRFTALLPRGRGTFMQFGSPDRRVNLVGFPQGRAELEGFDTFILGDVDPTRWSRTLAAGLAQTVTEEGKSLVVIAGPNIAGLIDVPELHGLLPVELTRESGNPVAGPVDVRIRADGGGSSFFFQLQSRDKAKLPPLDQIYPPLRKRPAATVLLEAEKQANSYGKLIVVAEHTVGKGRVLFVGTDTLWKWQTLAPSSEGPTPYSLFWQQAFRALTPARSYVGGVQLWMQASRTRKEAGRPVVLEAEVQALRPLTRPKIQATVELPDKRSLPLAFAADAANPRLFRAEFESDLPGPHTIKASVLAEGKSVADGSTVVHMEEARGELHDRGIDHGNLQRLAAATGGKTIDPTRPETWPDPGDQPRPVMIQERTVDLWNNFTLMLLLCGLLATDWVCRIMKGFV